MNLSLVIAAVSLNQYAARRFVGLGSIKLDAQHARKSIAAGCGVATTYVQVYAIPPLRAWQPPKPQHRPQHVHRRPGSRESCKLGAAGGGTPHGGGGQPPSSHRHGLGVRGGRPQVGALGQLRQAPGQVEALLRPARGGNPGLSSQPGCGPVHGQAAAGQVKHAHAPAQNGQVRQALAAASAPSKGQACG